MPPQDTSPTDFTLASEFASRRRSFRLWFAAMVVGWCVSLVALGFVAFAFHGPWKQVVFYSVGATSVATHLFLYSRVAGLRCPKCNAGLLDTAVRRRFAAPPRAGDSAGGRECNLCCCDE